jgi:hypothetical protein
MWNCRLLPGTGGSRLRHIVHFVKSDNLRNHLPLDLDRNLVSHAMEQPKRVYCWLPLLHKAARVNDAPAGSFHAFSLSINFNCR